MWYDLFRMKLNVSKTKTMIVSGSCTIHPQSTPLTLDKTALKESADLVILRVLIDAKMTFERYLLAISRDAAPRLSIMRKFWHVFHDRSFVLRSFGSFVLLVL